MMEKTYNPAQIEQSTYARWEKNKSFEPSGHGVPYSIVLPPPNVTGSLHMGHGFQDTLMDILIRYQRMMGNDTLWQPGVDHAGIATQMVVERQLQTAGQTREGIGREQFVEKVWAWKEKSGDTITRQMRRLGASADWKRQRFTLDEGLSDAVKKAFVTLHEEGLIYRGTRLVNWDPSLQTAVSDLEVISTEKNGSLWYINYPVVGEEAMLTIATTRPETLLGDTAVAVHPEDTRFQSFIGKQVQLPLCDRVIPIIADEYVDREFGTGCLKITPAHDFNDYELGLRHDLPRLNILTKTATINQNGPKAYQGMDRFQARKQIVADLAAQGLLVKIEPHTLSLPTGERNNVILEPYLTQQWFVSIESLAKPAIDAVTSGDIQFVPENAKNIYFEWMHNIQDWCISRQLWWGHQIPAWYDEQGNTYVAETKADVYKKYTLPSNVVLTQDDDVLDTWFSAALWPFSSLGWPEKTDALSRYYPTSTLVTGFDIIFFWVARMIMFGLKFTGKVPFKTVYFHGLIRDHDGKKMSKSKGNVIDPIDLIDGIDLDTLVVKRTSNMMQDGVKAKIEKATKKAFPEGIRAYGTDALRFTFSSLASRSRDIRFDIQRLEGYRNFCNKLWNAARFVLMQMDTHTLSAVDWHALSPADQWVHGQLNDCIEKVHAAIGDFRFDLASNALYEFTWNTFCDWYLECAKVALNDEALSETAHQATRITLVTVLERILKLAHPFIPFITDSIWQALRPYLNSEAKSIMVTDYPTVTSIALPDSLNDELQWVQGVISAIRTLKSEMNIAPAKRLTVYFKQYTSNDKAIFSRHEHLVLALAKLETVHWSAPDASLSPSMTTLAGKLEIHVPMAGLIDIEAERARLQKAIMQRQQVLTKLAAKLDNPHFADKAPKAVVEKEKAKQAEAQEQLNTLTDTLVLLSNTGRGEDH